MIKSRQDYLYYLSEDLRHHQLKKYTFWIFIKKPIIRFQRRLRRIEYLTNCKGNNFLFRAFCSYLTLLNDRLSVRLGFTIPINTIGPGLCLPHYGTIVVASTSTIGKNCRIHHGVGIGIYNGGSPIIGDNVYIGPGAKLFGNIKIGSNVSIGANSVVNKSVEDNVAIAGVPAKVISYKTTYELGMFPKGFLCLKDMTLSVKKTPVMPIYALQILAEISWPI